MNAIPLRKRSGVANPQESPQLELDLFVPSEQTHTAKVIPFEPRFEWDESSIFALREGLLWDSLRVLADGRAGEAAKQEAEDWMMSDEIHPFSFVVCCNELGYVPAELREQTLDLIQRHKKRLGK